MSRIGCTWSWIWRHWYVVVMVCLSAALVILAWTWAGNQASDRRARAERIIRQGDALIAQNDRVIDCTTPGRECFEEAQRRTAEALTAIYTEIGCRFRRALAGLQAPDLAIGSCPDQTPPSVFPGGAAP